MDRSHIIYQKSFTTTLKSDYFALKKQTNLNLYVQTAHYIRQFSSLVGTVITEVRAAHITVILVDTEMTVFRIITY